jgi:glycerophosphoryl diester phosphodiesterase
LRIAAENSAFTGDFAWSINGEPYGVLAVSFKKPTLSLNNNKYIDSLGNIVDCNGYSYTNPIAVKKGDYVIFTAVSLSIYLTTIAKCTSDGTITGVCVTGTSDTTPQKFTYLVTEDGFLCFSGQTANGFDVRIINQINATNAIESLKLTSGATGTDLLPFEIGNIVISTSGWTYGGSTTHIRTPNGYAVHCKVGDVIKLTSYTSAHYKVGWKRSDNTYGTSDWLQTDFIVREEADYVMIVSAVPEATVTDVNDLASLARYEITRTVNDTYNYINTKNDYLKEKVTGLANHLLAPASPKFVMHRGYSSAAPENTIPAFVLAGKAGAFGIETDVYQTTDGVFVCMHDNDVSRTTNGTGNIYEKTYAEVQALTIDAGANIDQYPNLKVPTLAEYLAVCRRYGSVANIDIKRIASYEALITEIKNHGMIDSCVFSTDGEYGIKNVRQFTNAPIILFGYEGTTAAELCAIAELYTDVWVSPSISNISGISDVNAVHAKHIPVSAWATSNITTAETLISYGVDCITSDSIAKLSND